MKAWLLSLLFLSVPLHAAEDLAAREAHLATQLRCVVCQNQTVAESNAPLAADMRREIRTQLESGSSDAQVVAFFEQRYGAFVHYSPPFKPSTWLLWGAPFVVLIAGLALLLSTLRRRSLDQPPAPLDETQRARARRLLEEETP
jgi:cytochrome c-type biogenesis protein CcmH